MSDYNSNQIDDNTCGCCVGRAIATPLRITNRSGLDAVSYRIGTHAAFKESMLACLSCKDFPALNDLLTRDDTDFTIALLDGWATVADVLTFYMERLANESYLRTALDRRSIIDLARLIGYRVNPGVAAEAMFAFTVDEMPALPEGVTLPVGSPHTATSPTGSAQSVTIEAGCKVQSVPGEGERAQLFETTEDFTAHVEWNAIPVRSTESQDITMHQTHLYLKGADLPLATGDGILIIGDERGEKKRNGSAVRPGNENWDFRILTSVEKDDEHDRTIVKWARGLGSWIPYVHPAEENVRVFGMRTRASLFGHNAPDPNTLNTEDLSARTLIEPVVPDDNTKYKWVGFEQGGQHIDLDAEYKEIVAGAWLVLDTDEPAIRSGATEVFGAQNVTSMSRSDFAVSAKITRITPDGTEHLTSFPLRETRVFLQSEELTMVRKPIETPLSQGSLSIVLGVRVEGLSEGQAIVVRGRDVDDGTEISEIAEIKEVSDEVELGGDSDPGQWLTKIVLTEPLTNSYDRESVLINANVVMASHGETVREYLGSGDARVPYQSFELSATPLTYVVAPTPSGAESTLEVYVDDVKWEEVTDLYGQGPNDHVYVTRIADDGKVIVQFGDGLTGARLPTGQSNVRAEYRKGIGLDGNLKAGQLSLLMTRPLGVNGVVNPQDAEGGDDPELLEDARQNAPLTVLTMDRVVSLRDYEDFARAFSGVRRASASHVWNGLRDVIVVTVAGPEGAEIPKGSTTYNNLSDALTLQGVPNAGFRLTSYRKVAFNMEAELIVDPDYVEELIQSEAEEALRSAFSFEQRSFAQPVWASEVVSILQAVEGVEAVDLNLLYRDDENSKWSNVLRSDGSAINDQTGDMEGAEMVILDDTSSITLTVRS